MKKAANHLSFFEHLDELRSRLIKSILAIILFSIFAYQIKDEVLAFLIKPVGYLIFTSPADAFVVQITLSLFVGFLMALPFVCYQNWLFIASGLKDEERRFVYTFGPASLFLFCIGVVFAYTIIIPISLKFLLSFSNEMLAPMISIKSYISFLATVILAFGVIFEFPLVVIFLTKIGIATPAFLSQKRKYAIVLFFIVSALITPPDLITQLLMAFPLIVLYEISIVASRIVYKEKIAIET